MRQFWRWFSRLLSFLLIVALALGAYYWFNRDNVHVLLQGQFVRSAQLEPAELKRVIKRYQIRSVLNLRGAEPKKTWYQQELALTQSLGVQHVDIHLQAHSLPAPSRLRELVGALQTLPRPVLIHCKGGADRTGLASAAVMLLHDASFAKADRQISWRYFAIARDSVGRLVMPFYQCFLQKHQLKSRSKYFLEWVRQPQPFQCD